MKKLLLALSLVTSSLMALETVPFVDLKSYLGTWYEIGKFQNWFQKDCGATTATYTLKSNGKVDVFNRCEDLKHPGKIKAAFGVAGVANKKTNAELKVSFVPLLKNFGLFAGDYFILDLAPDYSYALVGAPSMDYLWVLSRTPTLDPAILDQLLERAKELGFDTTRFVITPTWKKAE